MKNFEDTKLAIRSRKSNNRQ